MNTIKINSDEEYQIIISILLEVCYGFRIDSFEEKIGAKKEVVVQLMERLRKERKSGIKELNFSSLEIVIIKNSLTEVELEMEWSATECMLRIGAYMEEIKKIIESVLLRIGN